MATEALMVILALIGIGIIVVVTLLLLQRQQRDRRPVEKVVIREEERPYYGRWWGWDRSYSHVPVRPVLYG